MNKLLIGTTILVVLAGVGMVGDYYLIPNVTLVGEKYTEYEYDQIRPQVINKVVKSLSGGEYPTDKELSILWDIYWIENQKRLFNFSGLTENNSYPLMIQALALRELEK